MDKLNSITYIKKMKFIRDIIVYERTNLKTGESIIDERVVIKLQNQITGESRIHIYTSFLDKWKNTSTNTVKNIADAIIPFLNYITFELNKSVLPSIHELTFEIGADYLNLYGENRGRKTVKQRLKALTHFYLFLVKNKVITSININSFQITKQNNRTETVECEVLESLVKLPRASNDTPRHDIEEHLIIYFIFIALKFTPSIALGVYFQIFGGLRYGEILNITYSSIKPIGPNGRNGMVLNLKNRFLRPELKEQPHVKKPRTQDVLAIDDLLQNIFVYHKKNYKAKNSNAVFVDNNMQAMSLATYRNNFNKLKFHFIDELKKSGDIRLQVYAIDLMEGKWSTHIGRGIFSNVTANNADNIVEIALKRGDSNLNSSLTYLTDSKAINDKIKTNMSNYYNEQLRLQFNNLIKK